jgi:hypothetical protein
MYVTELFDPGTTVCWSNQSSHQQALATTVEKTAGDRICYMTLGVPPFGPGDIVQAIHHHCQIWKTC